jgi:fucose 4-O-acetylase-like acetyltransferase
MKNQRDIWIDNVKIVACILVVMGHFFQSMLKSGIMQNNSIVDWFITTIYCFHVPLFFICSGFLYQKYSIVRSVTQWKNNIIKKFFALGIPYFTFSIITWLLKRIFSSSVSTQVDGFWYTLFCNPLPPYWYLYTLFLIFIITITAKSKIDFSILLTLSLICKLITILGLNTSIYAIDITFSNWVWFVFGILIATNKLQILKYSTSLILFSAFIILSILTYLNLISFAGFSFIKGIMACYSIIGIIYNLCNNKDYTKVSLFCSKYTMPVFLMHTIFAAPIRSILLHIGISNSIIHIAIGIIASFCGPILAMIIMEKIKPLDFFVYPTRYIHFKNL